MRKSLPPSRYGLSHIRHGLEKASLVGPDRDVWGNWYGGIHHSDLGAVAEPRTD